MGTDASGLYKKLAEVMSEVGYVQKKGFNTFHRYKYVTEHDLLEAVREKLAARNVALIPAVESISERAVTTDKGKASCITTVRVSFTFCDGDTGATHVAEWAGAGDDPADKGIYKAYTGAMKYFLMKCFLIPTGDDPEADEQTDKRAAGGQRSAPSDPAVAELRRPVADEQKLAPLSFIAAAIQAKDKKKLPAKQWEAWAKDALASDEGYAHVREALATIYTEAGGDIAALREQYQQKAAA